MSGRMIKATLVSDQGLDESVDSVNKEGKTLANVEYIEIYEDSFIVDASLANKHLVFRFKRHYIYVYASKCASFVKLCNDLFISHIQ